MAQEIIKSKIISSCGLPLFAEENNSYLKYLLVTHSSVCLHCEFRKQMQFRKSGDFFFFNFLPEESLKSALVKSQLLSMENLIRLSSSH